MDVFEYVAIVLLRKMYPLVNTKLWSYAVVASVHRIDTVTHVQCICYVLHSSSYSMKCNVERYM